MGKPVTPALDRRVLFARLLDDTRAEPPLPTDRGETLIDRILSPRLQATYLSAARPWPEDSEAFVHDLRVSSRRLVEALALLTPIIGRGPSRRAQKSAKALRQALGASREADVLVANFRKLAEAGGLSDATAHALDAMAQHGQQSLRAAWQAYPPERLITLALDTLGLQPKEPQLTLTDLVGAHLSRQIERTGPLIPALGNPKAARTHHALRIACKHLRYSLEIIEGPFGSVLSTDDPMRRVKHLQNLLGDLNDAQDLLRWLRRDLVTRKLGKKLVRGVQSLAMKERVRCYEEARDGGLIEAPVLLAILQDMVRSLRAAGT